MRIHILQHVWFEDEANIGVWAKQNGHALTKTLLFKNETLPSVDQLDWLVILGGPMSINDETEFSWLVAEKKFIKEAISKNKIVLGVCLGAQLIASVLGSRVYKNPHKEIGWFDVELTDEASKSKTFTGLPKKIQAFHWHGETFDLPAGCVRIAKSEGCDNQAFEYKTRVVGLQFHVESSVESISRLIQNCPEDLVCEKFVQTSEEILKSTEPIEQLQPLLNHILDHLQKKNPQAS